MPDFKVTFVTAFFDLNESRPNEKSIKTYIDNFIFLANSNIPLCLYTDLTIANKINSYDNSIFKLPYIKLYIVNKDTTISQLIHSYNNLELPRIRNINKDTYNYMILINSKIEYLYKATINNPFNTEHFAWIDFGIFHVINNYEIIKQKLYNIAITEYKIDSLIIPGCWEKGYDFLNNINWRFCGGFLLGYYTEIVEFYKSYLIQLKIFLDTYGMLVWEVNFWAWLENNIPISIEWYLADHNDTIFNIPNKLQKSQPFN